MKKPNNIPGRHPAFRRQPGLEKALSFLKSSDDIRRSRPIREMAHSADVSYVTMWKAVQELALPENIGDITHRQAAEKATDQSTKKEPAWQQLSRLITADMLQDRISRSVSFPQIKDLCLRYRTGYRTMHKALGQLCTEEILYREGRRYRYNLQSGTSSSLTMGILIFIAPYVAREIPVPLLAEYEQDYLLNLEREAGRSHIGIELLGYRIGKKRVLMTDTLQKSRPGLSAKDPLTGYILPVSILDGVEEPIFASLFATGKPVVIIDEIGGWELPDYAKKSGRFIMVDAQPREKAGSDVARTLIALGHRRCAFFSPFHTDSWSQQCLNGLARIFTAAGKGFTLSPFTSNGSLIAPDKEMQERIGKIFPKLHEGYWKWKPSAPDAFVRQLDPYFTNLLGQQIAYAIVREGLDPLFKQAFSDASITCWMASDIDTAWFANDYLRSRNSTISLITFGWSPEVTKSRITAYDFNATAAVRASLEFLLRPQKRLPGQEGIRLCIQGTIINRETLARKSGKQRLSLVNPSRPFGNTGNRTKSA
jgi:hypothetical protein